MKDKPESYDVHLGMGEKTPIFEREQSRRTESRHPREFRVESLRRRDPVEFLPLVSSKLHHHPNLDFQDARPSMKSSISLKASRRPMERTRWFVHISLFRFVIHSANSEIRMTGSNSVSWSDIAAQPQRLLGVAFRAVYQRQPATQADSRFRQFVLATFSHGGLSKRVYI